MILQKILVPLDGSKNSHRGLINAIYLARQCDASITGISVIQHLPVSGIHDLKNLRKRFLIDAKSFLSKAKRLAAQKGIDFKEKISYGDAGVEITKLSRSGNFDAIVIGSRGRGATKAAFFGSVSNYVIHNTKVPVILIK